MTGKEAKERLEKQYKRQNEHIKENYDRISITLPKGTKEKIKRLDIKSSLNHFINMAIYEKIKRMEQDGKNDL